MHITDIQNNQYTCVCVGCAIAAGEIIPPGGMICESEHFVLHQDPEVPFRGFLIIASKRHIRSIAQMCETEAAELFSLVYRVRLAQEQLRQLNEVRIIQKECSGHFHLWLLPWEAWMEGKFVNSWQALGNNAVCEGRTEDRKECAGNFGGIGVNKSILKSPAHHEVTGSA